MGTIALLKRLPQIITAFTIDEPFGGIVPQYLAACPAEQNASPMILGGTTGTVSIADPLSELIVIHTNSNIPPHFGGCFSVAQRVQFSVYVRICQLRNTRCRGESLVRFTDERSLSMSKLKMSIEYCVS